MKIQTKTLTCTVCDKTLHQWKKNSNELKLSKDNEFVNAFTETHRHQNFWCVVITSVDELNQ